MVHEKWSTLSFSYLEKNVISVYIFSDGGPMRTYLSDPLFTAAKKLWRTYFKRKGASFRLFLLVTALLLLPSLAHAAEGDEIYGGAQDAEGTPLPQTKALFNKSLYSGIDWKNVRRVSDLKELHAYVVECAEKLMEDIPVVCIDGYAPSTLDVIGGTSAAWVKMTVVSEDEENEERCLSLHMYYRSGARIAHAYLNRDTSGLTEEEEALYEIVEAVVKEIKEKNFSDLVKLLLIHDVITNSCSYFTTKQHFPIVANFLCATGVFLDSKANCQGYSDAFYMLAKMLGFNVGFCTGMAGGGLHIWNTVELDKKIYYVDVTWDDPFKEDNPKKDNLVNYIYFIAPREVITQTHSWDEGYDLGDVQEDVDEKYFYATDEYTEFNEQYYSLEDDDARSGLVEVADGIVNDGAKRCYLMIPYDKKFSIVNNVVQFLDRELHKLGWNGRFYVHISSNPKWKYMFYTIVLN